jgi:uncharacterized protein YbjT (DUF2867 family)
MQLPTQSPSARVKILITGATGNIGAALLQHMVRYPDLEVWAGVRNVQAAQARFADLPQVHFRPLDLENPATFAAALAGIDRVFLLRPPHLADVNRFFRPLIDEMVTQSVRQAVLLSVQGAETSKWIPHRQIELLMQERLEWVFLRPSYFMQNLTTTLLPEIRRDQRITLPAGRALFNWVDIADIAEVAATVMHRFEAYRSRALVLSGPENLDFFTVVDRINRQCGTHLRFDAVGPWGYYRRKRAEGMVPGMIAVTLLLHFLPRFQPPPAIASGVDEVLGRPPRNLDAFIAEHCTQWLSAPAKPDLPDEV